MILFKTFSFESGKGPEVLVNSIIDRKDFEFRFDNAWFDLIAGRKDRFRLQPDGSVYLKLQRTGTRRKIWLKGKMVFRIKPSGKGSEVKVLLRPDLFWIYLILFMIVAVLIALLKNLLVDPILVVGLIFFVFGITSVSFYKDQQFFEHYLEEMF